MLKGSQFEELYYITVFSVQKDILVRTKKQRSLLPDTLSGLKIYQKRFNGRAQLVKFNSAPNPTAEFGGRFVAEREGREKKLEIKRKEEKAREGNERGK